MNSGSCFFVDEQLDVAHKRSFGYSRYSGYSPFWRRDRKQVGVFAFDPVFCRLAILFPEKTDRLIFRTHFTSIERGKIFTRSLGKDVYLSKVIAFTLSAMIAAIPDTLYAHYISYIDPTSFTVDESIFIPSIVIIGGMRNLRGSVVAASFLVCCPKPCGLWVCRMQLPPICSKLFMGGY